jgi:hypothetical protein
VEGRIRRWLRPEFAVGGEWAGIRARFQEFT